MVTDHPRFSYLPLFLAYAHRIQNGHSFHSFEHSANANMGTVQSHGFWEDSVEIGQIVMLNVIMSTLFGKFLTRLHLMRWA